MVTVGPKIQRKVSKPNREGVNTGLDPKAEQEIYKEVLGANFTYASALPDLEYDPDLDDEDSDWYDETRSHRNVDAFYVCTSCNQYMKYERNGSWHCKNVNCDMYLAPFSPRRTKLATRYDSPMGISEQLEDSEDSEVFVAMDPNDGGLYNTETGRTIEYKDTMKRIAHVKYRNFPKDLSLRANS